MRKTLVGVALLLAFSAAPAQAAEYQQCDAKIDSAQFFGELKVSRVSCLRGAEIARPWVRRYGVRVAGGQRLHGGRSQVRGWSCNLEILQGSENPYGRVTCRRGKARIVFYG